MPRTHTKKRKASSGPSGVSGRTDLKIEGNAETLLDFQDLPAELKLRIFSYFTPQKLITTIAGVCKTWQELSLDPSLWKDLRICVERANVLQYIDLLRRRSSVLRKLTLRSNIAEPGGFDVIPSSFSSETLEVLRMEYAYISKKCVQSLKIKFPNLQALELYNCDTDKDAEELCKEIYTPSQLKIKEGDFYPLFGGTPI